MEDIYWPGICGNRTEYDAFWNQQITLNTSNPDVTVCFQRTVLSWFPSLYLLVVTIPELCSLRSQLTINGLCSYSKLNFLRTLLCMTQVVTSIILIFIVGRPTGVGDTIYTTPADLLATCLRFISMLIVFVLLRWQYMKGVITSGVLCFFWLFTLFVEIVQVRSTVMRMGIVELAQQDSYFITYIIYFTCVCLQFVLTFFVDNASNRNKNNNNNMISKINPEKTPLIDNSDLSSDSYEKSDGKETAKPCPHDLVNFWARLTFQWLFPDVIRGYRKQIVFENLYALRIPERCRSLLKLFTRNYYITEKSKDGQYQPIGFLHHRGLFTSILRSIFKDFAIGVLCRLIAIPVSFINPQLLSLLIVFIGSGDPNSWKGIAIAVCMLIVNFTFSILMNNFLHRSFVSGSKARSIVNTIVYRKSLRLSSTARKETTTGQVVNLMSVDAQKVQDMFIYSTLLWSIPILIGLCIYFLWTVVGVACLAGLGVLAILVPINAIYFANKVYKLQRDQMKQKDKRFRVMNEILAGMKVLKLYAWEPSFEDKILGYRNTELKTIKNINFINAFGSMCWLLSPYLVSLAIFAAYVLVDSSRVLTADKAFVTISLIGIMNWPLSILPLGVAYVSQGIASIARIQKFLDLDELDDEGPRNDPTLRENKLVVSNGTYSWGRDESPTLKDINIKIPDKGLVAIVGAVGSGKSSLINAILGEMFALKGEVRYNGKFAYVPQQAWIVHNTLKENIVFGKPLNSRKYQKIIKACALEQDLAMLPGGDQTEIGEKVGTKGCLEPAQVIEGINLSGGQKQRVSLARAVYQDEDIYLLDDPLSAVDAHVGKHIFDHVIGPNGILKSKTRVLVTHGITYLPRCDMIIVLKDGCVEEVGKYEELLEHDGEFAEVIRSYLENEAGDESDEETEAVIRDVISRLSSQGDTSDGGAFSDSSSGPWQQSTGKRNNQRRSRQSSRTSKMEDAEAIAKGIKLVEQEKEEKGNIGLKVVTSYLKACGFFIMTLVGFSHIFYIVFQIMTNIWLSEWTSDISVNATYDRERSLHRLSVYGYLGIGQFAFAMMEAFAVAYGCYSASLILHKNMLFKILRAPMAFFDTTPLGRILNRFSKDMDVMDSNIPIFLRQWLFAIAPVIITVVVICYSTPIFAVVFLPLSVLYVIQQRLYVTSMRQWRRIDAVRRSPIYTHFDESVVGSTSIRAYRREQQFIDKCDRLIDESQRPWYLVITAYRWASILMECLGAAVVFFSSLFAVLQRDTLTAGMAGLSVSYALQVTVYMSAVIRTSSELEGYVVSVERIDEYINIGSEAAWDVPSKRPPKNWPELGAIQFSDYCTRYREGLDLVLKNINCYVRQGERIGIVGRTGAGKSSLSLALFRIIEAAAGSLYIDGRCIADMGLHALRSRISIIPQDPVVFSGSLRSNVDPFGIYSDHEVWQALEHAHLKDFVMDVQDGLGYECGENGEALSVGQRQLLCLARALLRGSKILVLDEATAAVDFETDSLIQTTIREKFKHCTILTVAHRLYTVMDYDRIMVLDKGKIKELDSPSKLMADKSSVFHSMARDAGLI